MNRFLGAIFYLSHAYIISYPDVSVPLAVIRLILKSKVCMNGLASRANIGDDLLLWKCQPFIWIELGLRWLKSDIHTGLQYPISNF